MKLPVKALWYAAAALFAVGMTVPIVRDAGREPAPPSSAGAPGGGAQLEAEGRGAEATPMGDDIGEGGMQRSITPEMIRSLAQALADAQPGGSFFVNASVNEGLLDLSYAAMTYDDPRVLSDAVLERMDGGDAWDIGRYHGAGSDVRGFNGGGSRSGAMASLSFLSPKTRKSTVTEPPGDVVTPPGDVVTPPGGVVTPPGPTAVPETATTVVLFAAALLGLFGLRRLTATA